MRWKTLDFQSKKALYLRCFSLFQMNEINDWNESNLTKFNWLNSTKFHYSIEKVWSISTDISSLLLSLSSLLSLFLSFLSLSLSSLLLSLSSNRVCRFFYFSIYSKRDLIRRIDWSSDFCLERLFLTSSDRFFALIDRDSLVFMIKSISEEDELTTETFFIEMIARKLSTEIVALNNDKNINETNSRKFNAADTIVNDRDWIRIWSEIDIYSEKEFHVSYARLVSRVEIDL